MPDEMNIERAIEAAAEALNRNVNPQTFDDMARAAVLAALPYLKQPEKHVHYHIPEGSVCAVVGDTVHIEPAPSTDIPSLFPVKVGDHQAMDAGRQGEPDGTVRTFTGDIRD